MGTAIAYVLGVPLALDVQRRWPQMREVVQVGQLVAEVEAGYSGLTAEVGRRVCVGEDTAIVESTCDHGDGRVYRNVSIAELGDGQAVMLTDYWGEPCNAPARRRHRTARLDMSADELGKDYKHLRARPSPAGTSATHSPE